MLLLGRGARWETRGLLGALTRVAKLNTPRLGRIRVYRAANAPWPSALIAGKPSVKDAGQNAAGILTAVSATTTTKHIPAFGNPFRVSTDLRSELLTKN